MDLTKIITVYKLQGAVGATQGLNGEVYVQWNESAQTQINDVEIAAALNS